MPVQVFKIAIETLISNDHLGSIMYYIPKMRTFAFVIPSPSNIFVGAIEKNGCWDDISINGSLPTSADISQHCDRTQHTHTGKDRMSSRL